MRRAPCPLPKRELEISRSAGVEAPSGLPRLLLLRYSMGGERGALFAHPIRGVRSEPRAGARSRGAERALACRLRRRGRARLLRQARFWERHHLEFGRAVERRRIRAIFLEPAERAEPELCRGRVRLCVRFRRAASLLLAACRASGNVSRGEESHRGGGIARQRGGRKRLGGTWPLTRKILASLDFSTSPRGGGLLKGRGTGYCGPIELGGPGRLRSVGATRSSSPAGGGASGMPASPPLPCAPAFRPPGLE
jgi:hypothetical protein